MLELEQARILVTNDDGIHAPGLEVMEKIAKSLAKDVWVVAPELEQSGASHSLTLSDPLRVRKISRRRYAVRGTPTDCVMMGVHELVEGKRPDLILAGVNRGGNLGEDVTYSGTIAAAMEGTLIRIPSIALSQSVAPGELPKWSTAGHHGADVVRRLVTTGWHRDVLINVNFPDVPHAAVKGLAVCRQGRRDFKDLTIDGRIDARGQPYYWLGFRRHEEAHGHDTDLAAVMDGRIAITPLQLDLTATRSLKALEAGLT